MQAQMQPTNYHKQRTPISAKSHALKIQPSFVSRFIRNSTGAIIETYISSNRHARLNHSRNQT